MLEEKFRFAFSWRNPQVWHVRRVGDRGWLRVPDTPAICGSQVTADVGVEITLERLQGNCCLYCSAMIVTEVVSGPDEQPQPKRTKRVIVMKGKGKKKT